MVVAVTERIRVRAIAFDLDGTLLDTVHDLATAVNMMLGRLGYASLPKETIRTMIGKGVDNLVKRALLAARGQPSSPADEARAVGVYEETYERTLGRETVVFPGVREGLERLASAGFGLACITNKSTRFTRPHLDKAELSHYFSLVLGGDSLAAKKPDPMPLKHAARHFGVNADRLLMCGDSAIDTQAARAAGSPVFCVPYGYNEGRPVQSLDCDGIVSSLDELPERIRLG